MNKAVENHADSCQANFSLSSLSKTAPYPAGRMKRTLCLPIQQRVMCPTTMIAEGEPRGRADRNDAKQGINSAVGVKNGAFHTTYTCANKETRNLGE